MGGATAVHAGLSPMIDLDDVPTAMLHGAAFGGVLGLAGRGFAPLVKRYRVASEPHAMTRPQFEARARKGTFNGTHEQAIERALKEGDKKVPDHVLMEYPHLVEKYVGEAEAIALRQRKAAVELGAKDSQPKDIVEYWADLKDPLSAPTGPSLVDRIGRKVELNKSKARAKQSEVEFKEAKKAYEDTIGEPWEKVEPFLERQRAAEVKLKTAKVEVTKLETKIESLRDSVDKLVKDIVENPDKHPDLMGDDVAALLDFIEFRFGSDTNLRTRRGKLSNMGLFPVRRTRVGANKLHQKIGKEQGFDRATMKKAQAQLEKQLTEKQNKVLNDVLNLEARRLEKLQGKELTALESELNTATKEARLQGEKGDRALDVARKRQSRNTMEAKSKREAAHQEVRNATADHLKAMNAPATEAAAKYVAKLKENLVKDIEAGKPVPEKALEHFPELRKMDGVKTYAEARKAKAAEVKEEVTLSEETIRDIDKTIPDEALKPIEPIEPPLDAEIQALKDKAVGPTTENQTVKSIEKELAARGLPKSKKVDGKAENKLQKLERLDAHDLAVLEADYRGMQKLLKNLKAQGFKPTNIGKTKADYVAQIAEFREQVKNPPKVKVEAKVEGDAPKVEAKKVKGPEPEPVSDAVALSKFDTTPIAGMPKWREWFGKRWFTSFTAEVGSSKSFAPVRWIGEKVLQDSIAKIDGITGRRLPTSLTGQTRAEMQTYGMFHELGESYQVGYTKWRQEHGVSSTERMTGVAENDFGSLVADAVRDTYKGKDPNVMSTAEAVRKTLKQLDEHMVKEGLTEKVFDDPNYFPRKILPSHVSRLLHKAERGALDKFVADAIKKGYEKEIERLKLSPKEAEAMRLTPEEAQVISDIYLTNINTRNFAVDYNNNGFLGDNSALVLGEYLEKLGIKPEVRKQILKKTKVTKDAVDERFLKHRLLLDEGHMGEVLGKDGQLFTVTMTDFFDNNAKRVMNSHIRQVHGAIESRKIGLNFNEIRGLSSAEHPRPATWREMSDFVHRTAIKDGRSPIEIQKMGDQMRRMQELVGGYTTEKVSELGVMARMMQKFAGATYGGSFGMAAIAELGQPMAHTSIKAFMTHIGELPKIINDFRTGKISGELQRELAMLTGVGTEGRFFREVSTMLEHHPLGTGEQMSKMETIVGNLQNGAFKLGLLTSIDAIQRQYAGMLFAQEMLNGALAGKSSYSATRLMQIGLSPEMNATIFKHIKKHAKFEGTGNNKLNSFNFKDWVGAEGRDAAASLQEAIVLHTKKTIHQTHAGQLPRIMQNPIGRLLMQFRNFTIGSYETQLLSNLQAADGRAVASMTTNTFFGLLSYLAIINVKYAGNQEMLDKYLSPSELAKGAFFRSGYATHVPALLDTLFQVGGFQPQFSHGRSSGLATGFLSFDSTPVGSIINGITGTGSGVISAAFRDDYKYSQKDYRQARKVIPYQNAIGFGYLHGKLAEAFPEESRE
tara:strand:- start:87 stop:4487 length:4401 start_codon:yes stop_codon:yes gene_type:complete